MNKNVFVLIYGRHSGRGVQEKSLDRTESRGCVARKCSTIKGREMLMIVPIYRLHISLVSPFMSHHLTELAKLQPDVFPYIYYGLDAPCFLKWYLNLLFRGFY